jgi:hypothetical protein
MSQDLQHSDGWGGSPEPSSANQSEIVAGEFAAADLADQSHYPAQHPSTRCRSVTYESLRRKEPLSKRQRQIDDWIDSRR